VFLFEIFRSFLPIHNPIGFGAADFIEFTLAVGLLALALIWRPWIMPLVGKLSRKTAWCMLLLAVLPVLLRLALIPHYPIPVPRVTDDFSYLLLADTFRHFRMSNPVHPLYQFFETFFVLQQPSYSSIFPPGQGILLAVFWLCFGSPWVGVAFSIAALSSLTFWMLRGWVTQAMAFLGGIFAALMFGPLNQWMNSYWGGALSAIAGCLVFGSLPRLIYGRKYAVTLGAGLAIQLLTRPFEFVLLAASVVVYLLVERLVIWKQIGIAGLCLLPAIVFLAVDNHAVTGSWTTLPYQASRYQYGIPASFTFEPNPIPHNELTREQELDYEIQSQLHGTGTDSPGRYVQRLFARVRFARFFFLAPLYGALVFFLLPLRNHRSRWILFSVLLFVAGTNFYPYFYPHYIAALTCLLILAALIGGIRSGPVFSRVILYVACFHFVFWYGVHLIDWQPLEAFEAGVNIDRPNPDGRTEINQRLDQEPGKQLVFVRYSPRHEFEEWVHNSADIDGQKIVWARDLGSLEDEKLRLYYAGRIAWILEPDTSPPTLSTYQADSIPTMEQVP
jgi:hypothetical protein